MSWFLIAIYEQINNDANIKWFLEFKPHLITETSLSFHRWKYNGTLNFNLTAK